MGDLSAVVWNCTGKNTFRHIAQAVWQHAQIEIVSSFGFGAGANDDAPNHFHIHDHCDNS